MPTTATSATAASAAASAPRRAEGSPKTPGVRISPRRAGGAASVKGRGFYLEYVPRTLEYVRTNLERHAALDAMRRVLARHLPELC